MNEKKEGCSNCRHQMTGFDGGFFGLPFTCECRIYGETENRKSCPKFQKKITKNDLFDKINELEKENERLQQEVGRLQKIVDLTQYKLKVQDRILTELGE